MGEELNDEERILTPDIISEEPQADTADLVAWEALLEAYRLEYSLIKGEVLIARQRIRNCLRIIWEINRDPYIFAHHPQMNMVEQAYGLRRLHRIEEKRDPKGNHLLWRLRWKKVLPDGFFGKRGKALAELREGIEDIEETVCLIRKGLPPGAEDLF